jgi:hypothetical protein
MTGQDVSSRFGFNLVVVILSDKEVLPLTLRFLMLFLLMKMAK